MTDLIITKTSAMLARFINAISFFLFGRDDWPERHEVPRREAPPIAERRPSARPAAYTPRTKTQERPDPETFSELLEHLDDTFDYLEYPDMRDSWLEPREVDAIKTLGIYVPTPWEVLYTHNPVIPKGLALPAMASCFLIGRRWTDTKDGMYPKFMFAKKQPGLPANTTKREGTVYKFGVCYDPERSRNLFWVWAYIVVRKDGTLYVPRELRTIDHTIVHKHRRRGEPTTSTYSTQQWLLPAFLAMSEDRRKESGGKRPGKECELSLFRQLLVWWTSRDQRWSVGVKKGAKRAIFSIAQNHTAAYFADRNKTVTAGGKTKKIVHYVREHTRVNGQTVRAHIRGQTDFIWRGYECHVTAPRFNSYSVLATTAPVDPILVEQDGPDVLTDVELAGRLVAYEEQDLRERSGARH